MTAACDPNIFTSEALARLFPPDRADKFFEALLGDPREGAYDISLDLDACGPDRIELRFTLTQRRGKCLACNLTYGLPQVFSRHPVINVKGLVREIEVLLGGALRCTEWKLGDTRELSRKVHIIPFTLFLAPA